MITALREAPRRSLSIAQRIERQKYQLAMDEMMARMDHLEAESYRTILARVAEIRKDVVDRLIELPTTTDAAGNETWQAWQLRGYQQELDRVLRQFRERYAAEFGDVQQRAADLSGLQRAALTELAMSAGVPRAVISFGSLGLLQDQVSAAIMYNAAALDGVSAALGASINREIQQVVFGGQSRWDAVRNIRAALATEPGSDGKLGGLTERAITLERTALISVYSLAQDFSLQHAAEELPGLQSEWVAILDRRTDPVCKDLGGKRVPVGKAFPGGIMRPPAHMRCRCRLVAFMPGWPDDPFPVGTPHRTADQ